MDGYHHPGIDGTPMQNQYQPPPLPAPPILPYAQLHPVQEGGACWQDRGLLVARKNTVLPARCVRCNQPAEGPPIKRLYTWHNPMIYLLILAGILVYAIVALCVQEKAQIFVGICAKHRSQRNTRIAIAWIASLGGLVRTIVGAADSSGWRCSSE